MFPKDTARGGFWIGAGMLALGVADATLNPFGFATAPEFFTAGVALIVASMSAEFGKGQAGKGKDERTKDDET